MRTYISSLLAILFIAQTMSAQDAGPKLTEVWHPAPRVVTPGNTAADAPSDAIVLFDGKDFSKWESSEKNKEVKWALGKNRMTVVKNGGGIQTKSGFGDCQLHIEWRTPDSVKGEGQGRGNSGIFFMSRYELQVLDSYKNTTYSNGQAGSIYKQHMPLVNASRGPGEWQTYDVLFTAPRFNADSTVKSPARITVFHNGVLIQNDAHIIGSTAYTGIASYTMHADKMPLMLQDHGDAVSYRNIWIREL
jgi:hypothetical protein